MLVFAQFGAGRIGAIHAGNIAQSDKARLRYVVDVNIAAAQRLASRHGAEVADVETALADPEVTAVLIASSTDTHADLAMRSARAGKAIFCEKPIDLSLQRVDACLAVLKKTRMPMHVGFHRRFDPSFKALHDRIGAGDIGKVEQVIITSRDPGLPPPEYIKVSGGQFRDMTIHDFDMARWLLGEEPAEIFALGACLVDPKVARLGDTDSVMVVMRTASGRLCHINNSRRAAYGLSRRARCRDRCHSRQAADAGRPGRWTPGPGAGGGRDQIRQDRQAGQGGAAEEVKSWSDFNTARSAPRGGSGD